MSAEQAAAAQEAARVAAAAVAAEPHYLAAELMFRRALAIRAAAWGNDHPNVAQSVDNLANLLVKMGRHDEARQVRENYTFPQSS